MRVCDNCRDPKKKVLTLRLGIVQPDPGNGRLKPKELEAAEIELCETCVAPVWDNLVTGLRANFDRDH